MTEWPVGAGVVADVNGAGHLSDPVSIDPPPPH